MTGALALGVATGWAGAELFRPSADAVGSADHVLVEVTEGEVGASIHLNTVVTWPATHTVENAAAGMVTAVDTDGTSPVDQGHTLYRVDLRPIVAARGVVPAFRAIEEGVRGDDVAQVQTMLGELGFLEGAADGRVDARTTRAIRAWQRSLGVPVTGAVAPGDVVFLPTLPARVRLDPAVVQVGHRLAGGEAAISVLQDAPAFTLPVAASQAVLIPPGTQVQVTAPDGSSWPATAEAARPGESPDVFSIALTGEAGGPVCADACASVPVAGESRLAATVVTVAQQSGLVVPTAAIVTGADGSPAVLDDQGGLRSVQVIASARGMSLIEGVPLGTPVQVRRP
ncbi:peptidoglycan-binding domain-containing protein [Propioniciclava soli]|uniref:Peptidoglycan-binding domain-containing protein n=1 Tax=Propioniciclava soli TaxID=2775081 RepID=A0ABZ3CBQ9_9ACTN